MPRITHETGGGNVCALLDTLAYAEIGPDLLAASDDGYDVLVGSVPGDVHLFASYADHPLPTDDLAIEYADGVYSTAAGRYQILNTYWPHYKRQLGLPDFSPESQDRYAIQQLREQGALTLILDGYFKRAIAAASNIWASLPGAGYGQPEHEHETLARVYVEAGGLLSGEDSDWFDRVVKVRRGQ
ncbi:glycoside hydrolase family protein [Halomonas elongata]|uniref:Endolysin n=1 Tax=Halomonas elongata (strain ATCC 33173 / DSM 2581 / NBRC 15536 / NCIMB 2198 / 1H9) TaxID=768066 RepID=E1V355_HALED|nr:glycoside hydrolase family 104 protein [Halomonas elongata]WBF19818.1 glycoside hydrolase family 104 protein [Halomonas elongata]WPU48687.1 glycoside hydrolase family 104 protein [Halomonas elongata DSM 2581]CBV42534.1 endolysin [Halomonas elongata DSM 2581]